MDNDIFESDPILNNMLKRKRKLSKKQNAKLLNDSASSNKSANRIANNPFLSKRAQTIQCNTEIFDTLDDVSTDDSDIQITHVSEIKTPVKKSDPSQVQNISDNSVIELNSDNELETVPDKSLDYLTAAPECCIVQEIDYFKRSISNEKSSTNPSYLSSYNSDIESTLQIHLDDDLSFHIDGNASIDIFNKDQETQDTNPNENSEKNQKKRKHKSKNRFPDNPEMRGYGHLIRYWAQRFDLFQRFDMGIKLDKESWYSVTPEYIAKEQAELCKETDTVLDGFCGAGGNTIQFVYKCNFVMAIDIDPVKVELNKNNCKVYGVDMDKVSIMKEDLYEFADIYESCQKESSVISLPKIDVVFLSPPWGGTNYLKSKAKPVVLDIDKFMTTARKFRPKTILIYLPRTTQENQVRPFLQPNETLQMMNHAARYKNQIHDHKKIKAITAIVSCNL